MTATKAAAVLKRIRELTAGEDFRRLTDPELLERFMRGRDPAAFEALLRRYGPLVLGVCRRVLANRQDAEDAFQATFLVLAQRVGSIRKHEALASWLYVQLGNGPRRVFLPLTITTVLLGVQGLIGHIQWDNQLPAGLVFVHVSLACATWVALLWSVAAAGTKVPVRQPSTRSAAATASGTRAA